MLWLRVIELRRQGRLPLWQDIARLREQSGILHDPGQDLILHIQARVEHPQACRRGIIQRHHLRSAALEAGGQVIFINGQAGRKSRQAAAHPAGIHQHVIHRLRVSRRAVDPVQRRSQRVIAVVRDGQIIHQQGRARLQGRGAPGKLPEEAALRLPITPVSVGHPEVEAYRQPHQHRQQPQPQPGAGNGSQQARQHQADTQHEGQGEAVQREEQPWPHLDQPERPARQQAGDQANPHRLPGPGSRFGLAGAPGQGQVGAHPQDGSRAQHVEEQGGGAAQRCRVRRDEDAAPGLHAHRPQAVQQHARQRQQRLPGIGAELVEERKLVIGGLEAEEKGAPDRHAQPQYQVRQPVQQDATQPLFGLQLRQRRPQQRRAQQVGEEKILHAQQVGRRKRQPQPVIGNRTLLVLKRQDVKVQ